MTHNNKPIQVISVTGGKGGVGKTNLSVNLAISLAKSGKSVLLLDADLGLSNVDVLLGMKAKKNIAHVISGECTLKETVLTGPFGIRIVPASSGTQQMSDLSPQQQANLIHAFDDITDNYDVMIVDTAAGISNQVLNLNGACHEHIVVVCNEPTSITDAYAVIKLLSKHRKDAQFRVVANMVENDVEGRSLFFKLEKTAQLFLSVNLDYLGTIPFDERVKHAVQQQRAVTDIYPTAKSSQAFKRISEKVCRWPLPEKAQGNIEFFWQRLLYPKRLIQGSAL